MESGASLSSLGSREGVAYKRAYATEPACYAKISALMFTLGGALISGAFSFGWFYTASVLNFSPFVTLAVTIIGVGITGVLFTTCLCIGLCLIGKSASSGAERDDKYPVPPQETINKDYESLPFDEFISQRYVKGAFRKGMLPCDKAAKEKCITFLRASKINELFVCYHSCKGYMRSLIAREYWYRIDDLMNRYIKHNCSLVSKGSELIPFLEEREKFVQEWEGLKRECFEGTLS